MKKLCNHEIAVEISEANCKLPNPMALADAKHAMASTCQYSTQESIKIQYTCVCYVSRRAALLVLDVIPKTSLATQYFIDASIIPANASFPSSPTTSPIPGARSKTLRCGNVPATSLDISPDPYPMAFNPRGTPSPSRNRAMASKRCWPSASSGIRAMEGSETEVLEKMARASRCRSGAEGAVNWKTAGPVRDTLTPWGTMGLSSTYPGCLYFGPVLLSPDICEEFSHIK